jgi:hypothetical protein
LNSTRWFHGQRSEDQHAIADLKVPHILSQRLDDAYALVPEDRATLRAGGSAAHPVQIGPADRAARQPDDGVGRVLN